MSYPNLLEICTDLPVTFGGEFRRIRELRETSVDDVGSALSYAKTTIYAIEQDSRLPDYDRFQIFIQIMKCNKDEQALLSIAWSCAQLRRGGMDF